MIIAKGAEAVISLNGEITKERIKKGYRLQQLDVALRKKRNRTEAALLREARRAGINVPQILEERDFLIKMDFIDGNKVKDIISEDNCAEISTKIAEAVSKLHNRNIIHGDLTTSNMILEKRSFSESRRSSASSKIVKDGSVYFIDFGLGFFSPKAEDKAVDLYLLHEALESTHFNILEKAWATILETYRTASSEGGKVIKTLAEIEKRGRYKER